MEARKLRIMQELAGECVKRMVGEAYAMLTKRGGRKTV
jgi:hypothetical protein